MTATTFFGNRASCKVLNTWNAGTYTFTNGSTTFSGSGSAGDYVWVTADGVQYAHRVASAGTLAYPYLGVNRVGQPGYYSTPETLQVLRGLEMNISWDTAELYGTDSILRVDEAKHTLKVETKAKYCKWDPTVTVDWLDAVLHPLTTPDGTTTNTNICFVNGVVYTITGTNGTKMEFVCGRTYWEGVPYPAPENDFIIRDITGKAASVTAHSY
jgi:hypothetical protein